MADRELRYGYDGTRELALCNGRVAPGMEADLVFPRSDPSQDVRNVRKVELVVTNGEAHRFDDLVAMARSALDQD